MTAIIELKVNGQTYHLDVEPETPLLYVLRNELGLKGVKYTCGLEQCGACHVLIDSKAVPSCHLKARSVQGLEIYTIEGLGTPDKLHPLQEAFIIEEQAVHCGYCTAGLIIAAQGLLIGTAIQRRPKSMRRLTATFVAAERMSASAERSNYA